MEFKQYHHRYIRHFISTPFILGMIVPLGILDICAEIYHRICFPLYGIPYVSRSRYIRIDRHRLPYLGIQDKIQCAYCGYANGLIHYVGQIAAKTEQYWCGIQHQKKNDFVPLPHHAGFLPYGDEAAYRSYIAEEKK